MGESAPALQVDELRAVFGAGAADPVGAPPIVEQVYEPVVSASSGIWRVRAGDRSAILKLVAHSTEGHVNWLSGEEPSHWYYWRREVLAYESGLLESLPGDLRAPACHLVAERDDGSVALWLEDLRGRPATRWTIGRYGLAARHLGRTQGAYLTSRALPDQEWLSRDWMRDYLTQRDGDLELVDDTDAWQEALVAASFPTPPVERLQEMRGDQSRFLDALDRLPRTLCHLDLHPANLFAGADGGGRGVDDSTVAIDWSFVGIGSLGEDAGNLVPDAVLDFHVAPERLDELYETVAAGYASGLRDAGWDGPRGRPARHVGDDRRQVRVDPARDAARRRRAAGAAQPAPDRGDVPTLGSGDPVPPRPRRRGPRAGVTDFVIRTEETGDHRAIRELVAAAFGSPVEARLVDEIRNSENFVEGWSLVAVADGRVVGHVMVSYVALDDGDLRHRVPSLSPLAVTPDQQRRGIGGALVRAVAARVDAAGEPLVVLEGSPTYYGRFGFEPSTRYRIDITLPDWAPPEAAEVLRLRAYDPAIRGHVVYPPAFDAIEDR